jgi:hypothetical protein
MANTERLKTIKLVREAKNSVSKARFDPQWKKEERGKLEKAFNLLDQLEDDLILQEVSANVAAIQNASAALETVAKDIEAAIKKLEAIAELIHKAAMAAKVLADIAAKAASGGIG